MLGIQTNLQYSLYAGQLIHQSTTDLYPESNLTTVNQTLAGMVSYSILAPQYLLLSTNGPVWVALFASATQSTQPKVVQVNSLFVLDDTIYALAIITNPGPAPVQMQMVYTGTPTQTQYYTITL
jgi:hypothetical protein